jgi:hypothetical protein
MGTAEPGNAGPEEASESSGSSESSEDARAYAAYARRLRSLPADQVLGDFLFSLLNTAQVKLGRRDARLLIDVAAVAHDHARAYLPGELTTQVEQALGQLRMGQVNAENHAPGGGQPEENDLAKPPAPPPPPAGAGPGGEGRI